MVLTHILLATAACRKESGTREVTVPPSQQLTDVDTASWARLARRRVFFGHQSVGQNIIDGMKDVLAANRQIRLSVVESKEFDSMTAVGFYHARVGRNQFPEEKEAEFASIADSLFASGNGIGMLKFCFVDVSKDTDPQALFQGYERRMKELATRHPGLILVHFTMPLTRAENGRGYWMRRLLGRPTERALNAIRNRYNQLLRAAYLGREPVFDLAAIESTRRDGSRTFFTRGNDTVFTLAEEYTTDGGHLNQNASWRVAEQLLTFLARLP